jgi:hypothetical protein
MDLGGGMSYDAFRSAAARATRKQKFKHPHLTERVYLALTSRSLHAAFEVR